MKTKGRVLPAVLAVMMVALVLAAARIVPAAALETTDADGATQSQAGAASGADGAAAHAAEDDAAGEKDGAAGVDAAGEEDGSSSGEEAGDADAANRVTEPSASLANVLATQSGNDVVRVEYDALTGIHSLPDSESALGSIILYCMNDQAEWPHSTPSNPNVPEYTLGYLTPNMFDSQQEYDACMEKLLAILYAGYPYNGLNMYEVGSARKITEEEFNRKLDAPNTIRSDFPDSVGDTTFTYGDYTNKNTANLTKLHDFLLEVGNLYPNKAAKSGMTYRQITGTDFYQAAYDMYMGQQGSTPLEWWDATHGSDYYTDSSGAYWGTQYAIWVTLKNYGVSENDLTLDSPSVTNYPLAAKLVQFASASEVLRSQPDEKSVSISGDAEFAYDPATKSWRTGALSITEGANYNGRYTLTVPAGISVVDRTGNPLSTAGVRALDTFYLQSLEKPEKEVDISASAELTWLKETRQYSPVKNADGSEITITDNGKTKPYQHMIGAVIKKEPVSASLKVSPAKEGELKVAKSVKGEQNPSASFEFTVSLGGAGEKLNGTYGDMTFENGVATVSLKNGDTKSALHLPDGTTYTVTETPNDNYAVAKKGDAGTIETDETSMATFTNTRLYGLTVQKTVVGQAADKSKAFPITITLTDADGKEASGSYKYTGSVASGATDAKAPADGTLEFKNGSATVNLAHGQRITIAGIPSGYTYKVAEGDHAGYDVSYAGESGTLDRDGATATVTNTLRTGSLKITKRVNGEKHDLNRKFTFTVKLTGAGEKLNGTYGDLTFKDGVATAQLGKDDSATAEDLPEGTGYTVTEEAASGYESSSENASGSIEYNKTAEVTFTNTLRTLTLPLTGESGVGATYAIGATLLVLAAGYLHVRRVAGRRGGDGRD